MTRYLGINPNSLEAPIMTLKNSDRPLILDDDVRGYISDAVDSSLSISAAADNVLAKFAGRASIKQVVVAALDILREEGVEQ